VLCLSREIKGSSNNIGSLRQGSICIPNDLGSGIRGGVEGRRITVSHKIFLALKSQLDLQFRSINSAFTMKTE
jgi:hypothetical protein